MKTWRSPKIEVREDTLAGRGVVAVEDYPAFVRDVNNYLDFWRLNSWTFAIFGALLTLPFVLHHGGVAAIRPDRPAYDVA